MSSKLSSHRKERLSIHGGDSERLSGERGERESERERGKTECKRSGFATSSLSGLALPPAHARLPASRKRLASSAHSEGGRRALSAAAWRRSIGLPPLFSAALLAAPPRETAQLLPPPPTELGGTGGGTASKCFLLAVAAAAVVALKKAAALCRLTRCKYIYERRKRS